MGSPGPSKETERCSSSVSRFSSIFFNVHIGAIEQSSIIRRFVVFYIDKSFADALVQNHV